MENQVNFAADLFNKKELKTLQDEIAGIAQYLWERGWAERNAGNFSINITGMFSRQELEAFSSLPSLTLAKTYPDLARTLFLISGTGTRMRDVAVNPTDFLCFVYVGGSADSCHISGWGSRESKVNPTSELATHLAIQQLLIQQKSTEKVVLHAHVTELIALTQLAPFKTAEAINAMLWCMHPETMLFVPEGLGLIPFNLPGSENMAMATLRELGKHKAILWEKHGCIAVGNSCPEAFDTLDILAKSARIYFLCKSAGLEPEGFTSVQVDELRTHYAALGQINRGDSDKNV